MTTLQIAGLTVILVLALQWGLAMPCLMRLFKAKLPRKQSRFWNICILAGIIVGPIVYLATEKRRKPAPPPPQPQEEGGDYSI